MADLKPPRGSGDERATLTGLLQFQRESMLRKVEGLDDAAAARTFVDSGTSLVWLLRHLSYAERVWVLERFAGAETAEPVPPPGTADSLADAVAAYKQTWAEVDAVVAASDLDAVAPGQPDLEPVNLRWILGHLLEETARHAGHADILRELIDGQTGR